MNVNGEKWTFYSIIVSPAIFHTLRHGQVNYFGFNGFWTLAIHIFLLCLTVRMTVFL